MWRDSKNKFKIIFFFEKHTLEIYFTPNIIKNIKKKFLIEFNILKLFFTIDSIKINTTANNNDSKIILYL